MAMMTLLVYTLSIWAIGLGGALAPLAMATYNMQALALCNSAAAGVMLGAGFHLLHDASISLVGLSGWWGNYPVAEFTCGLAFLLVFYIEALFAPPVGPGKHHVLVDHMQVDREENCFPPQGWAWQDEECGASGHGRDCCSGEATAHRDDEHAHASPEQEEQEEQEEHAQCQGGGGHEGTYGATGGSGGVKGLLLGHMHHTRVCHPPSPDKRQQQQQQQQQQKQQKRRRGQRQLEKEEGQPHPSPRAPPSKEERSPATERGSPNPDLYFSPTQPLLQHRRQGWTGQEHDTQSCSSDHGGLHSLAGALCLAAALGFHAVIEGLGLATASYHDKDHGGQDSTQLGVFLAILAHKGLAGITLGSTLLLAAVNQTQFLTTALVFSAATPFGVGCGVLISSYYDSPFSLGLMAAVAAGTFIHVAAIEIIPSAFKDSSATQLAKLLSLTFGYLAMTALSLVTSTTGTGGGGGGGR